MSASAKVISESLDRVSQFCEATYEAALNRYHV